MKAIKVINVEHFATQKESFSTYSKSVTSTRWMFSNGVEVSITRHVMAFNNGDTYKSILITPIQGLSKNYLDVSEALSTAQQMAEATFSRGWNIKLYL